LLLGKKPYLTEEEEKELVSYVTNCAKMGYGKTRQDLMKVVKGYMNSKSHKISTGSTNGWFIKRWPELRLLKGDSFAVVREQASSCEVYESYFNLLNDVLTKNMLKDKPGQIYNCDESRMPLQHKIPKVVSTKSTKKVHQVSSGNKTQITVLGCATATGQGMPPMVVFTGKYFNHNIMLSRGEVPGTLYGMSPNRWMDQELFSSRFFTHFLKHAVSDHPLMLILDGHSSHYTLDLVKTAAAENVIMFCLPPHTTADSQPLDTSCFGPLKKYWYEVCRQYLFDHPGQVVTKFQFSTLFADTWSKGLTIGNVTSGFLGTGIYPFSSSMVTNKFPAESNSSSQPSTNHVVAISDSQSDTQSDSTGSLVEADLTPEMIEKKD